jgi:DnaK suppressor protein
MGRKDVFKEMKEVLTQRRQALRQALAGDDSMLRQMNQNSGGDVVDFASDSAIGELSSQLAEVASRELINVEVALKLMNNGHYGACQSCGCSILLARLQALPYATNCIDCQRESEKSGLSEGCNTDWGRLLDASGDELRLNDMDFNIS